jgi:hypothetical protein
MPAVNTALGPGQHDGLVDAQFVPHNKVGNEECTQSAALS